ncbi:cupredoxin domain-containing protein [Candidatus Kaiserbacteria bacterium]|nr:cupredoxin domain-containing protein [Candidatus Kaiserbacteria bacterium]
MPKHMLFTYVPRPVVLGIFVFAFLTLYIFFGASNGSGVFSAEERGEHGIVLREGGFYPSSLTIQTGDSVFFKTMMADNFWPASDPHPIHTYYPENVFDSQRPIAPNESWQFIFNEPGTWRYHDHLNPSLRGEITVLPKGGAVYTACKKETGQCFDEIIRNTVKTQGVGAAYALFAETYEKGELPRACHWTAHQIGEEAYELFKRGEIFSITYETSYCGYGFFHGFMEGLLREDPDVEYALSFCDEVGKQLGLLGLQNCYHGIGHGFTEDPPDPRVLGNFEAMIAPGIEVCEYLFKSSFTNLNLCLTGVFTVPAGFAEKDEYGLSLDPEDPFAVCRTQPYRYQKACYGEITPKLDSILEGDFAQFPQYLKNISDENIRDLIIWVAPSVMIARDILKDDFSRFATICRNNFSGNERKICWGGTILGFFTHGEPEKQYKKAISFCESSSFDSAEKDFCYEELFHRMDSEYIKEKMYGVCNNEIPKQYRARCLAEHHTSVYRDMPFE